jgi:hypothetical protein
MQRNGSGRHSTQRRHASPQRRIGTARLVEVNTHARFRVRDFHCRAWLRAEMPAESSPRWL